MIDQKKIMSDIGEVIMNESNKSNASLNIVLGVSNRHIHLSQPDVETLFGKGYTLSMLKPLLQPGHFAANETVVLAGPKGAISKVRVLGPVRPATQIEILISDGFTLGIKPPVRESGCKLPSPSLTLIGPKGSLTVNSGVLAASRHVHMSYEDARNLNLQDGDKIKIKTNGVRSVIFDNVTVRIGEFIPEVHIDADEANAADVATGDMAEVIAD